MNFKAIFSIIIVFIFTSCSENNSRTVLKVEHEVNEQKIETREENHKIDSIKNNDNTEKINLSVTKEEHSETKKYDGLNGLVDIQTLEPSILIDLKYASEDNFTKKRLYFDIDKVYLQKDVAERLSKVQQYLKELHPDLTLLVYDGVRPLSVQKAMWKSLDTVPVKERIKFVSNPANGSIHNYGAAVDLTIAKNNGTPLDMGSKYDDIRQISYPKLESYFLKKGELTSEQIENRKLLRKVMKSQKFTNLQTEWWHFNACSRAQAKMKYKILQ